MKNFIICTLAIIVLVMLLPLSFGYVYGENNIIVGDMNNDGVLDTTDLSIMKMTLAGVTPKPQVLDSGVCGENLTWALYDDGLLKISGTGRSYDYCKGLFGDNVTREEIEAYQSELEGKTDLDSIAKYERGFQKGKIYDDANGQYIAPWYKYRNETLISSDGTMILNPDGSVYMSVADYKKDNPNGWTYNRIEIDPGVTYIGNWFFYRICGPTELELPDTVTSIGQWSIRFSPTLEYLYLPDSVEVIEKRGCSRLEAIKEIRTSNNLKYIGDYAFAQNNALKKLVINGNIEKMGTYSFGYNKSIEYVEFTGIETLPSVQFVDCYNLKEVVLPQSLKTIETVAFVNRQIETINIPKNTEYIGTSAFYNCEKLNTVCIDSPIIAKNIIYSSSCGHLVNYANYVYINKNINEIGSYILKNYDKVSQINEYVLYVKK